MPRIELTAARDRYTCALTRLVLLCDVLVCGGGATSQLGKVDFAFQIFDYMITLQMPPNSHTFAHLIDLCILAGDLRRALQVLHEMKKAGWMPTSTTVEGVLVACARSSEPVGTLVGLIEQQRRCWLLALELRGFSVGASDRQSVR